MTGNCHVRFGGQFVEFKKVHLLTPILLLFQGSRGCVGFEIVCNLLGIFLSRSLGTPR
jgi:hypothetical protein